MLPAPLWLPRRATKVSHYQLHPSFKPHTCCRHVQAVGELLLFNRDNGLLLTHRRKPRQDTVRRLEVSRALHRSDDENLHITHLVGAYGCRPCSGCRKKGFAEAQCIDGCEQCRRSRTLCQGGLPCARCHKLRLDCSDDPKLGLTMMAEPAAKALCDRAKTACLACRRDNKKVSFAVSTVKWTIC